MIDNRQWDVGKYNPFDFEAITVSITAVGFTNAKYNVTPKPKRVFITCETARLRYRFDGTDPTATVGHLLTPGQGLTLEGWQQINKFKAIRADSTDATIQVTYLR